MNAELEEVQRGKPAPWQDLDDDEVSDSPRSDPESDVVETVGSKPDPEPEEEIVEVRVFAVESKVPLRVYLAACGHKWDQMQGFKVYAKTKNLGPLTMNEWGEAYQDYLNRPVV